MRTKGPRDCIDTLTDLTALIDRMLSFDQPAITGRLKAYFGLANVTADADFVNVLSIPLSGWQGRTWLQDPKGNMFFQFCDALTQTNASAQAVDSTLTASDPRNAFKLASYAAYIRDNIASLCDSEDQDECFGTYDAELYANDGLDQDWRLWTYQCASY